MAYDRFMIAPINTGLETDLKPWIIPDDAFSQLNNAFVFRGRVKKRFGTTLMNSVGDDPQLSRLRIALAGAGIGITDALGNAAGNAPGGAAGIFKVGQMFSIGDALFTVTTDGAAQPLLSTGPGTGTFSTTTGAYTFTGAPALTAIYFYPSEPVMGFDNYEVGPINNQPLFAFDTQFAYRFSAGWNRSGTLQFLKPSNINYVWATNWEGITPNLVTLFVTNFQVTNSNGVGSATDDPIWYMQPLDNWTPASGVNAFYFAPNNGAIHTGPYVVTAKLIVPFKDRLILLNTVENDGSAPPGINTAYPNRARFSFNGSPFARNAWYEPNQMDSSGAVVDNDNISAGAGWIDATTQEQIVSAEFIKDRLIVYFERSTWELAYTGNEKQPFVWQKLNTELGADSTFSVVPFDKEILCISNVGVHSCNGSNVSRIDEKIPDQVFKIRNKDTGTLRVAGIRDYFAETVYWTFPSDNFPFIYNNKILVYNYRNGTWAFYDDCINVWGYYEQATDTSEAWQDIPQTWQDYNMQWDAGVLQAQFRQIVAGNQQGFTFLVDNDVSRNAPVMQITSITDIGDNFLTLTIIDHTLIFADPFTASGDYISIEQAQGVNGLNDGIYAVFDTPTPNTVRIVKPLAFSGTYTGGGLVSRVSNPQILTKQLNPYDKEGRDIYVAKVDFLVDKTSDGELTIDYFASSASYSTLENSEPNVLLGNGVLETRPYLSIPFEDLQRRLWHPVYLQTEGECIQLYIYMSDSQIKTPEIAWSNVEIHAFTLYCQRTTDRLQ